MSWRRQGLPQSCRLLTTLSYLSCMCSSLRRGTKRALRRLSALWRGYTPHPWKMFLSPIMWGSTSSVRSQGTSKPVGEGRSSEGPNVVVAPNTSVEINV